MSARYFIAGDWGTSNLRLFLVDLQNDDAEQAYLDKRNGPGIAELKPGEAEQCLSQLIASWREQYGPIPIILAGMIGSSIGWHEVPYVVCPAGPDDLLNLCKTFEWNQHRIHILPGLSCINAQNAPDVMRGEEIQIFGLLALHSRLSQSEQLFCLPGTHNKWATIRHGKVHHFNTALAGELYDVLSKHSILCRESKHEQGHDARAFEQGLMQAKKHHQHGLLQQLFETRSRQLSGEFSPDDASSYLSGLIIGADVQGALGHQHTPKTLHIIGDDHLSQRYKKAVEIYQLDCQHHSGEAAVLSGLQLMYSLLPES